MNIHWNSETPFCDLDVDHNRAIQSFHKTIQLMMMCHQAKFSCKRISSSDNILKRHILIILSLTVTLTLKTANQSFSKLVVSWYFEPSQPQWITSQPNTMFNMSYIYSASKSSNNKLAKKPTKSVLTQTHIKKKNCLS